MNYFQLLFPDFSLIVCGFLICRFTALNEQVWEKVEQLVYWFLFPVLLFYSIVKTPLDVRAASSLIGAGLCLGVVAIAMSYLLVRIPRLNRQISSREHAACAQIAFRFNSFVALALVERVAGAQGLQLIAVLIGVCVPLFNTAAVYPMARGSQRGLYKELARNPLILATVSGLVCALIGLTVPQWLVPTVSRIGAASIALGLMAAGAAMQFSKLASSKALGASVLTIRHVFTPIAALLLAKLFRLDPLQTTVLLTFAALPTASSCHVLANRMGHDGALVAAMVTVSTALAMLSLPFALSVLAPMR